MYDALSLVSMNVKDSVKTMQIVLEYPTPTQKIFAICVMSASIIFWIIPMDLTSTAIQVSINQKLYLIP